MDADLRDAMREAVAILSAYSFTGDDQDLADLVGPVVQAPVEALVAGLSLRPSEQRKVQQRLQQQARLLLSLGLLSGVAVQLAHEQGSGGQDLDTEAIMGALGLLAEMRD